MKLPEHVRILLIRFSSIGDIVLTTPLLHAIKERSPHARIEYLTLSEYSELLRYNPNIDTLHLINRAAPLKELIDTARHLPGKYTHLLDLHRSTRSLIFRWFAPSQRIRTLHKHYLKRALLVFLGVNWYREPYSVVNRYFTTARALSLTPESGAELWISQEKLDRFRERIYRTWNIETEATGNRLERVRIERGLLHHGHARVLSLMPFATWKTKEWGIEKFIHLARRCAGEGATVLIHGGEADEKRAAAMAEAIGAQAIPLAGRTSLLETALLLSLSDCLVTNDTGIMHMGGATGIPVIALFGSTTRELGFFPFQAAGTVIETELSCRPCTAKGLRECPLKHFRCMNDITVDAVYTAVKNYCR